MSKRQQISCVAYDKRGRVISIGYNSYGKTHTLQGKYAAKVGKPGAIFLHAEIDALIKARGKKIHRVFVSRRCGDKFGLAKPCPICTKALADYNVKIVEWTI